MYNAEIGDYIGSESSDRIESDVNPVRPRNRRLNRPKEVSAPAPAYPPPMPSVRAPCVMRRYYSGDGRLIIREERARRHEYFQVRRSDGRLVMNLVPLDDAVEKEESEVSGIGGRDGEGIGDPTVGETVSRCYAYNNCGGFAPVAPEAFRPPVRT